ncbi:hypothetical protein HZS_5115 [Henneguya salminicola]|nr:hypothetical protein HZS_5115 [Henneguya salminicola]
MSETIMESSNLICQLNQISTRSKILMKFEKHPTEPTGALLYFGDKKYESVGRNIKESRLNATKKALQDFGDGKPDLIKSSISQLSSISRLYELSQKLNKKITIDYKINDYTKGGKIFTCIVSFAGYTAESASTLKKKSKEDCFSLILEQISNSEQSFYHSSHSESNEKTDTLSNTSDTSLEQKDSNIITPRDYQEEIFNIGVTSNIIICLGTGSGKTFIAVMLIKKFYSTTIGNFPTAKRIVMLVPTTALVYQQSEYIRRFTNIKVGHYCGESPINSWSPLSWRKEINENQVLTMTPEIFRQLLQHHSIDISDVSLLIFDECHHGFNTGHPYNIIMTLYYSKKQLSLLNVPRIIGLTASPALNIRIDMNYSSQIIKDRIENLENIYDAKCITAVEYLNSLKNIYANPKINVILYKIEETSVLKSSMNNYIKEYQTKIENFCIQFFAKNDLSPIKWGIINDYDGVTSNNSMTTVFVTSEKIKKCLSKSMNRCKLVLGEYGLYPLLVYIKTVDSTIKDILSNKIYEKYFIIFQKFTKYVKNIREFVESKISDTLNLIENKTMENLCDTNLMTNKLCSLVLLLCKHYPIRENPKMECETHCNSLIFTKQRSSSCILSSVLNDLAAIESQSRNLSSRFSCNFVVGVSTMNLHKKLVSGISDMNLKTVNSRLESFHYGAFKILFSTNVLEEGIDVRSCNVVIRLDKFSSLHSFIQSKGRIRQKESSFYIFEEEKYSTEIKQQISRYSLCENTIENILLKYCDEKPDNIDDTNNFPELSSEEKTLTTSQSHIDIRSAVSYIYRFCDKYSKSNQYTVKPRYFCEKKNTKIRMNLKLPYNCGITEVISSNWLDDEKLAKKHCSLCAIKLLYSKGLIDESFLPIVSSSSPPLTTAIVTPKTTDNILENIEHIVASSIPIVPKNCYLKSIPKALKNNPTKFNYHQYKIKFSEYTFCKSKEQLYSNMNFSNLDFGLLIPNKIADLSFPLASTVHSIQINIENCHNQESVLTPDTQDLILNFNKIIYEEFLDIIPKNVSWCPLDCHYFCLIVPLNDKQEINFDQIINYILFHKSHINSNKSKSASYPIPISSYKNKSIVKNYSKDRKIYSVISTTDVTPFSLIPDINKSYIDYYEEKWNLKISHDDLMLKCWCFSQNFNMLQKVNRYQTRASGCIYVPSACVILHPFDISFIFKLKIFPSILKRMLDFLNVHEWCENKLNICYINNIDCDSIDSFVHQPSNILHHIITSIGTKPQSNFTIFENFYDILQNYWIQASNDSGEIMFKSVFQAFTRISSNECCNYERLEILGDRVLSLIITMILFAYYPDNTEGGLAHKRDQLISNKNFYNLGIKLGLEKVMNSKPTYFGKNWCPPCCKVNKELFEGRCEEIILYQNIPEKAIADVVESLVGCCLISSNIKQVYEFLKTLNIMNDITMSNTYHSFDILLESFKNLNFSYSKIDEIILDINCVEKIINYDFKNKNIIAQAITHSSAIIDRFQQSYERLEFIGDTIIGFLILLYLYLSHEEWKYNSLSPYVISHLQHALVNNKLLGIISAKNGFIKCLQCRSYDLHLALSRFMNSVESVENSNIVEIPFLGLICKPQKIHGSIKCSMSIETLPFPKPAGDLLESIIGAVFVDTGCNMVQTAKIFFPFFKEYIENYLKIFPIHPKIYVLENHRNVIKNIIKIVPNKFQVILKQPDDDFEFIGIATNLEDAHTASCQCLMEYNHKKH